MKITDLIRELACVGCGMIILHAPQTATAETYVIHKDVANLADNSYFKYKGHHFTKGVNAFSSYWDVAGLLADGDEIFFGPHATGNITISKNNISLYGANAWCDVKSGKRTNAESSFTGTVKIANGVSGVSINGFLFTGAGCVRNDEATRGSGALHNISLVYNKCENTTLANGANSAIFYLGNPYRPASGVEGRTDPNAWAANCRYENINISHNTFVGKNAANQPMAVHVAGAYGGLTIEDNDFQYGGASVNIFNHSGDFKVNHNRFSHVGAGALASGSAQGEFCIRLFYIGVRSADDAVNGYIRHNTFDDCQGQSSKYSLIRFFSGDKNETIVKPVNTNLYVNHNIFRGKTSYCTESEKTYNYVFYANNGTCTDGANVDWRFNRYDNSELQFAWVKPAWHTTPGRFYASSSELIEHSTSDTEDTGTGTLIDYYGAKTAPDGTYFGGTFPTGNRLKNNTFTATTVVQSFDRDDVTGDFYFIQVQNGTYGSGGNGGSGYTNEKPVIVTRTFKNGTGWQETEMYLDWAGHGSNMGVLNVNGTCYLFIGGCQTSASGTTPTKVCIVPFVAGATVDVRKTSFTYGGKTYTIKHINRSASSGYTHPYPSVDRDNNLYVERSRTSAGDYFTVYELMDVFNNPSTARPIRQAFIKAGQSPIRNSSRAFYNTADQGFKTWSDQGFTISGDYIYTWEGNAKDGYSGTPTPTDNKPTMIINVVNWRTGQFIYRKAVLKSKVYGSTDPGPYKLDPGEPEGIKVHRDETGRANLLIGVVNGKAGARQYNVFAYRQKRINGQGRDLTTELQPVATMAANRTRLDFTSGTARSASTADVAVSVSGEVRDVMATITGEDGAHFSITKTAGDTYATSHNYQVSFNPGNHKTDYNAFLRLSTPGATDILVPLSGTYTGALTGVEDITTDAAANRTVEAYYDLTGRRLSTPTGTVIVRYSDGTVEKTVVKP